jgi:rubrerythrin
MDEEITTVTIPISMRKRIELFKKIDEEPLYKILDRMLELYEREKSPVCWACGKEMDDEDSNWMCVCGHTIKKVKK